MKGDYSMNFYPFHVGDYALHTGHLNIEEDIAYRRLLDLYYTTESPIPLDVCRVSRLIRMQDQKQIVSDVLSEFFVQTSDGYTSKRCDNEIAKYQAKAERAIAANNKRWAGHTLKSDLKSDVKSTPNQEPITKSKPKVYAPAFDAVAALSALGVESDLANEWFAVRRKKRGVPVTQRVIDATVRESGVAGITVRQAIARCCEKGWVNFDHTYSGAKVAETKSFFLGAI